MWSRISRSIHLSLSTESLRCLLSTIQRFGNINYEKQDSQRNTPMLWKDYASASTSNFLRLWLPKPLQINFLSPSLQMSSLELFIKKSRKDAISDRSLNEVLSRSLVHLNLLPFQSSQNRGNPVNTEIYKIIHSRLTLPIISLILQLIPVWSRTFFL